MTAVSRRSFLSRGAALAGGAIGLSAIETLGAHAAWAEGGRPSTSDRTGYGRLTRQASTNTGEKLLALPDGFSYVVFSATGQRMTDGTRVPISHDGMGAFPGPGRTVRLIRNHEVRTGPGTPEGRVFAGPDFTRYDQLGVAGTTTLDFDPGRGQLVQHFVSSNGTIVNCAGGDMLNMAGWITCEETTQGPNEGWQRKHGYCFVVPLNRPRPGLPARTRPIPEMGRFSHEAVAVDAATGFVYETEDQSGNPCGFYRFRPNNQADLYAGGVLEMLKIRGVDQYDTREGQRMGRRLPAEWVVIDAPDPDLEGGAPKVVQQGLDQGGAIFNRLEGCWYGNGSIYFNSTSGGDAKSGDVESDGYPEGYGQVWRYIPSGLPGAIGLKGALELVYESPGRRSLDSPDNLLFTPRGGIILCEDDASSADGDRHPLAPNIENVNRLIGLQPGSGHPFEFAVNIRDDSEFAGACFSPDGSTMFVNTFGTGEPDGPGRTYAITGPWAAGPL